ncbi:ribosomal protection-like ABC-F family protein [Rubeoparvulum massiliense]|uniref:ribosomal protection-like ABC-F family protein n=1 Tax=Rubeoparvulum massiliense TaxID=1631346 RepID=UPI00065E9929|nr:ABC-F type ribosomal protection protein [Rubeoparvulum massiliense]
MPILKVDNLRIERSGQELFRGATFEINDKERVALIGENGVGKTTLLRSLLGTLPIAEGYIQFGIHRDEVGWMLQEVESSKRLSTRQWVEQHHEVLARLRRELQSYEAALQHQGTDPLVLDGYSRVIQAYTEHSGYEWEVQVEKILHQLGLTSELWDVPFHSLSGGQKTRAKLAKVMMGQPRLLILDEPTNHLDLETIEWLQGWLQRYSGSVLFVSHEREFIDQVATVTYELTKSGMKRYPGGYQAYQVQKEQELKSLQALYDKQEQERKQLIQVIQTYKNWYQQANAAASVRDPYAQKKASKRAATFKAKEKALERLEKQSIERPAESNTIQVQFAASDFAGRRLLELRHVDFSYEVAQKDQPFLRNINLVVHRGDRIAVIGKNGSGKSTLLKLMSGELAPLRGEVVRNPQLKIGYFFQELENLHPERSIIEELLVIPQMTQAEARTILACFLFRKESVMKKIKELSMGEKCRVAFVKLYFSDANLLILDEPTNYLDIMTRERIEDALLTYPGTVVIVSHDPYLLRKVANQVVTIEAGQIAIYPGDYKEWVGHMERSSEQQAIRNQQHVLELELLTLLSADNTQDGEMQNTHMQRIKELKQQINMLKKREYDLQIKR